MLRRSAPPRGLLGDAKPGVARRPRTPAAGVAQRAPWTARIRGQPLLLRWRVAPTSGAPRGMPAARTTGGNSSSDVDTCSGGGRRRRTVRKASLPDASRACTGSVVTLTRRSMRDRGRSQGARTSSRGRSPRIISWQSASRRCCAEPNQVALFGSGRLGSHLWPRTGARSRRTCRSPIFVCARRASLGRR